MPCHNLGGAEIVAEVLHSAPWREGAPGITHQVVPNQLRRDAQRLRCTLLLFFSQRKLLGHSINEFVPLFQNHMQEIILGGKKAKKAPKNYLYKSG